MPIASLSYFVLSTNTRVCTSDGILIAAGLMVLIETVFIQLDKMMPISKNR
jgi:hypothetical protein